MDRAHFLLAECLIMLKMGLYFLALNDLDETIKSSLQSYFEKSQVPFDTQSFDSPQLVAKAIFDMFDKKISSEEFRQAISLLQKDL